ncbi:GH92 family glycosyl hydrolase [Albibacterium profundi]|uniref:GH92 family glycosyl hydrolase n=1 Tax=Albibacterium profundi TaxID=3134906 RepID=A0ABV5CA57_9SPHI
MKKLSSYYLFIFLLASLVACGTEKDSLQKENVLQYVDPSIGTAHSRWFFYTPAAMPYGMAKLAPATDAHEGNPSGWEAVGYDPRHESIEGFVHFHEWQIGGFTMMPTTGALKTIPGDLEHPDDGYRSRFSHDRETAEPGYYQVYLDDYGINAELTATKRVGFHRYTFPQSDSSRIIIDIGNEQGESGDVKKAHIRMVDETHFEGSVTTYPKYVAHFDPEGEISMYVYGELSKAPSSVGAFHADGVLENINKIDGLGAGLYLDYQTAEDEVIEAKVGLSYTSLENARNNLLVEASDLSFDQAKKQAQAKWQEELSKLYIEDDNVANKTKFYTGLYHALLGRGIANDVNGQYPQYGRKTGQLPLDAQGNPTANFMNTDAIWGAFWNITQLWALSYPEKYNDYIHSHLEFYKHRGWFADGMANGHYVSGVGTNFVGLALAAGYQIGLRDYDVDLAYEAIKANELDWQDRFVGSGKMDLKPFIEQGYIPYHDKNESNSAGSNFSASHTLEYSFSTHAVAQMAKSLGKEEDYKELMSYSKGWENLFEPEDKLIRPKDHDGEFIDNFDPYQPWRGFQEGNALQYSFYVPHDPVGLIAKIGEKEFNTRLNTIFDTAQKTAFGGGKEIDAFAGVKSVYNHGNQPSLHISWLFNFSGKPYLTQKWTRAILDEFYGVERIHGYGYGQDEDQGQLGSWYVMAALGLLDVKGLTDMRPVIQFSSPQFDKAHIRLGNGNQLLIETINNSEKAVYIQSATWNGNSLDNCWMYRDELMQGGTLSFTMGEEPNTEWGVVNRPPESTEIE